MIINIYRDKLIYKKGRISDFFALCESGPAHEVQSVINTLDVDIKGEYGCTALMFAAKGNNFEVVKSLLKHGADATIRDKFGQNALIWAAKYSDCNIIEALLNAGAEINSQDDDGTTALIFAAMNNTL